MQFHPTRLRDAWLIQLKRARDARGFFARTFCVEEFAARGLETNYPQHSISYSARRGTLRGMHYQRDPHGESKLVRCAKGAIWDVIIDIRPASPTYRNCQEFELSSVNGHQLYIPKGFAHGFQTLSMMSKSITSFPNPTNRNRPSAFGMTIRLLELPSPCP